jgi:hypothetical protein
MSSKDWSPRKILSLLKTDERQRFIRMKAKVGQLTNGISEDVLWLCDLVERLAKLTPEEYDFQKLLALVNHVSQTAYALRYDRREVMWKTTTLSPENTKENIHLLEVTTQSQVCDAVLVVRPYVRLMPGTTEEAMEELRKGLVSFYVDGLDVTQRCLIDEFLVRPDGSGIRRRPWAFSISPTNASVFPATLLDDLQQALPNEQVGVFLPNGTHVILMLRMEEALKQEITVKAGLVAARYTTKAL